MEIFVDFGVFELVAAISLLAVAATGVLASGIRRPVLGGERGVAGSEHFHLNQR